MKTDDYHEVKKEYTYRITALREALKEIPVAQLRNELLIIVLWFIYHNRPGNEFLWLPMLETIIVAIFWIGFSLHDCKVESPNNNTIFFRHIFFAFFSAIGTCSYLAICFHNGDYISQLLMVAIAFTSATSGALTIAIYVPLAISWLSSYAIVIIFVVLKTSGIGSAFAIPLVLFIFSVSIVEFSSRSKAFLDRYIFIRKMESQNETINQLYKEEKKYNETIKLYKNVLEQSPVSVVITDKDANIEYVNPFFTKLTGYTFEEAYGKNPRILNSNQTDPKVIAELWERLSNGDKWQGEFINKKKNGNKYEEFAIITPIRNADNAITHYVGIKEDITDRKLKELELSNALVKAEEATVAKSQFLANMSHEIRTPMNAIIGMSYLALKTNLDDKQKDYILKISNASTSLLGIINDILDFSKMEVGKMQLDCSEFNLDACVTDAISLSTQIGYEKGLEFFYHLSSEIPTKIIGDSLRLRQIVTNLVNNSIKFK